MYNPYTPYNNFSNPIDRIDNQMRELENLKKNYQNSQTQPTQNIFNVGNTPQIDFEARILNENEKPDEILIQRKTMFFDDKNGKLYIKELNGNITSFDVVLPKSELEIENDSLKAKIKELEEEIKNKDKKKEVNKQ